ncbi:S-adenosyl-L-methionine-dependent tRNA 4-demethylwyosine synthase like protein, partial [Aduncisulcus paluster]
MERTSDLLERRIEVKLQDEYEEYLSERRVSQELQNSKKTIRELEFKLQSLSRKAEESEVTFSELSYQVERERSSNLSLLQDTGDLKAIISEKEQMLASYAGIIDAERALVSELREKQSQLSQDKSALEVENESLSRGLLLSTHRIKELTGALNGCRIALSQQKQLSSVQRSEIQQLSASLRTVVLERESWREKSIRIDRQFASTLTSLRQYGTSPSTISNILSHTAAHYPTTTSFSIPHKSSPSQHPHPHPPQGFYSFSTASSHQPHSIQSQPQCSSAGDGASDGGGSSSIKTKIQQHPKVTMMIPSSVHHSSSSSVHTTTSTTTSTSAASPGEKQSTKIETSSQNMVTTTKLPTSIVTSDVVINHEHGLLEHDQLQKPHEFHHSPLQKSLVEQWKQEQKVARQQKQKEKSTIMPSKSPTYQPGQMGHIERSIDHSAIIMHSKSQDSSSTPHTEGSIITQDSTQSIFSSQDMSEKEGEIIVDSAPKTSDSVDIEDIHEKVPQATPDLLSRLHKQSYYVVEGGHATVKLCTWLKKAIAGGTLCYKHKFYGISTAHCCQSSVSLACCNTCVMCWRDQKSPVCTAWKPEWKYLDPVPLVDKLLEGQRSLVHAKRGVPGLDEEVWKSAHEARHVALSLVGESLLYPQINELILELHRRKLSTFLVSNSQLPEKLKAMPPVTQLYLSVDAADPDTLAEIDRPYVGKTDAWRRLNESLSILSTRQERTAIRITVIKKLNCRREDIPGYVKLIRLGHPCFIELKAFSFVGGTRHRHGFFSLANVPWPDQCVEYARWLEAALE